MNEDLIRRLAFAVDASLPYLDKQASAEKRREEGKPLRNVTCQQRAVMAHKAVAEAFDLLGLER